jgi:alpha-N-arabinofuranosidase
MQRVAWIVVGIACLTAMRVGPLAADEGPSVAIDAAASRAPVSKYIYGQFIEHLGRCIYGGIWAEMLEDRKYFHPVEHKESPWKAIGSGKVEMLRGDQAFEGQHTPVIVLDAGSEGGIEQGRLALREGKRYVGRAWLAAGGAGDAAADAIAVRLVWGDGPSERRSVRLAKPAGKFTKVLLDFTAGANARNARLEIVGSGGSFRVGPISLMPADNVHGMRSDTIALLKELDAPIYRWPGGNFVSGYDWRDGIGDPDRRPPRKNPAWLGVEHNDFGINEFMQFCREVHTEPYMVVNSGQGAVKLATDMLEYANGSTWTAMGKLRAAHGHPEPYKVRWWSIGNEMYGDWQLGHMPLEKYTEKHTTFAKAMRAVDPSIQVVAVGAVGPWSAGMLGKAADAMDVISEHFYVQEKKDVPAHVEQMPRSVRQIAEAHRKYRKEIPSLAGKDIRVALDEWNYWYGPHVFGELGTRYFLKDGLGVAAGLHEFVRNSDIYVMANYAQTVNVIGAIKTTPTDAAFETTGLVLKLYRKHFGETPVAAKTAAPLDVAAAWTTDRKSLTIALVNPTDKALQLPLTLRGARIAAGGRLYEIAGKDPMLFNDPGTAPAVKIEERPVTSLENLSVRPLSVSLWVLPAARE